MKNLLIATLLGSVAMTGVSYAQTATTPEQPAGQTEGAMGTEAMPAEGAQDAETMPAEGMESEGMQAEGGMGMQSEGGFLTYQQGSQMLGSGLMDADVRGADDESIGTVNDLVLDNDGQIVGVVVGVGGFLGIGEKDVAIANDQLEFVMADEAAAMDGTAAGTDAAAPAAGTATTAAPATDSAMAPEGTAGTTGTMGATGTAGTMGTTTGTGTGTMDTADNGWGWSGEGIEYIRVAYTREQLEDAPEFEYAE